MKSITKQTLISQIRSLGVKEGDTIFVAADLMRVGYFDKSVEKTLSDWVEIFEELLGEGGTLVTPTYSPSYFRFIQPYDFIFTADSDSNSGSFAKACLKFSPDAQRGRHPTSSCAYIGRHANELASRDGPEFPKYSPYTGVVNLNGKSLMLGIVDERNCPFTYHYAQEQLGQTKTHPISGLTETTYLDSEGNKKKFVVKEIGGCTAGAHKAWGYHLAANAVTFGTVGRSTSALVDAQKSAAIFTTLLSQRPTVLRCDNSSCISCYGRFVYNGFGVIGFYLREIPRIFLKILNYLKRKRRNPKPRENNS